MYDYHIILDFEMNPISKENVQAFNILKNEIIEIGAVKLNSNLEIVDRFNCLVKPELNYQVTPYITRLTGIESSSTMKAKILEIALHELSLWIGESSNIRIYSWSNNDLEQLRTECDYKGITFPINMRKWRDFQKVFPRMMNITRERKQIALKEALKYFDIKFDNTKVHNALYDAEITAELLIPILNGEYKSQVECVYSFTHSAEGGNTLGDMCGGVLAELLKQMQLEIA
ncbi:3'-5' exonuclease [Ruminococcus sp. zg-924]|uniref:3'-5' exonuclease n=1 Tax=Ruminococcus sp. zg-924 TaxID=2678505 RepID=UPI00210926A3|nr:3'-5' exonuclease [Ruminococcus sp. zg-924]MCQ4022799.1 hypothetical protein [Ruminococcus sp. zg-924]